MDIAIITQVRTTSTRLPAKVLLQVKGISLLEHHFFRLKTTLLPIYVATTINAADDKLVTICDKYKLPTYRGSEHDVLARFYHCASQYNIDIIIRVTSDCPLIVADSILAGLEIYLSKYQLGKEIYLSNTLVRTFPKGMDFEIFSYEMLKEAYENSITANEREHVTPYFYSKKNKDIQLINFFNQQDTSNLRITLDIKEDYLFIKTLIEDFDADKLSLPLIEKLITTNKHLLNLNTLCIKTAQSIS